MTPGFASRSTISTIGQFPQRDGAVVSDIAGMEKPGWSNSGKSVEDADAETKIVAVEGTEDKSVAKKTTARKSAQKKG